MTTSLSHQPLTHNRYNPFLKSHDKSSVWPTSHPWQNPFHANLFHHSPSLTTRATFNHGENWKISQYREIRNHLISWLICSEILEFRGEIWNFVAEFFFYHCTVSKKSEYGTCNPNKNIHNKNTEEFCNETSGYGKSGWKNVKILLVIKS